MPCYDHRDSPTYIREHEIKPLLKRNDILADLLCKAGRAYVQDKPAPPEVIAWWCEHAAADAARGEPWNE